MAKTNIASTTLLAWDEYRNKPVEEALPSIYAHARDTSDVARTWYWTSIKRKRTTSVVVRSITFAFVILGTLLPILAGLGDDPQVRLRLTQSGVAALALAGLLQVADRVFGWSSGWLRYITTVTAMESLTRKFELDWAGNVLSRSGALTGADVKALFDLAASFESAIVKLQGDETDKWVTEFTSGVALLGDLIKSQRESGEKAIEAAHALIATQHTAAQAAEKAKQVGAVELTLVHKAEVQPVSVALDEESPELFTGTVWSTLEVLPGQHTVTVSTTGAPGQTVKKVVEIPAGGVARVEVRLG